MDADLSKRIEKLLEKAYYGEITSSELMSEWPQGANEDAFVATCLRDAIDGLAHFAYEGSGFSRSWMQSEERQQLEIDLAILASDVPHEQREQLRRQFDVDTLESLHDLHYRVLQAARAMKR